MPGKEKPLLSYVDLLPEQGSGARTLGGRQCSSGSIWCPICRDPQTVCSRHQVCIKTN